MSDFLSRHRDICVPLVYFFLVLSFGLFWVEGFVLFAEQVGVDHLPLAYLLTGGLLITTSFVMPALLRNRSLQRFLSAMVLCGSVFFAVVAAGIFADFPAVFYLLVLVLCLAYFFVLAENLVWSWSLQGVLPLRAKRLMMYMSLFVLWVGD